MSAAFDPCGDIRSEAYPEKKKSHAVQCFIFAHVGTVSSSVEVAETLLQSCFGTIRGASC